MKGPKPPAINLSEAEEQALERLIKAHGTAQQIAQRARVIIAASRGLNNTQIARALNVSVDMARHWRDRWLSLQAIPLSEFTVEDRLSDLPRSGKRSEITADQICQIVALACEKPLRRHALRRRRADDAVSLHRSTRRDRRAVSKSQFSRRRPLAYLSSVHQVGRAIEFCADLDARVEAQSDFDTALIAPIISY